ncbi:mast cell-expressed membrane protein 1 isoform X2 [Ursus maritimus]|uniref:Mast cell-expressed membrane protein 1 isoform X2 n=1 Tax=Ursus maritimus TaxID=29073 RepID=A0A8M1FYS6_URSMA|nr:mast cell-expressed membrane protein 1 isoform X2 [Ursus maritimus]
MESEEIYKKQEVKMQAAAFKNKKQRGPADKEGADNPDYENITLTFRNQDQRKGSHSPPKSQGKQSSAGAHRTALGGDHVPTLSRPPSDSAQVPRCLQRALVTLHILLALSCIILLALVLAKISISVRECQEEQNRGWSSTQQLITEAKQDIDAVKRHVQSGNNIVKTLQADVNQIKNKLQEISKALESKPQS